MEKNYMKEYIDVSNEFRKSQMSNESIAKLYDLLAELNNITSRNNEQNLILSNIYSLLGFHLTAYNIFKSIADENNRKDTAKLFKMKEKAESHKDTFFVKDIRKAKEKQSQIDISVSDLVPINNKKNTFKVKKKKIVIFNKFIKDNDVTFEFPDSFIDNYLTQVNKYLIWLADCKNELIEYYNQESFEDLADDNWYTTLDVYRVAIKIDTSNHIYSDIVCGDQFWEDHLLDIEFCNKEIKSMGYDG